MIKKIKSYVENIKSKGLVRLIYSFSREISDKNIGAYAASSAFFLFLALVPLLIVICSVLPLTPITEDVLIKVVMTVMPQTFSGFVSSLINSVYQSSAGVISVAIIAAIWSASKAMLALMQGLNVMCNGNNQKAYLTKRGLASLYTLLFLFAFIILLLFGVVYRRFIGFIDSVIPGTKEFMTIITWLRYIVSWLLIGLVIGMIYTFVPIKKLKFKHMLPGAMLASLAWNISSFLFGIYLNFADFTVYGSLYIVIVLLLWMYMLMNILMFGMYCNNYYLENANSIKRAGRRIKSRHDERKRQKQEKQEEN